MPSHKGDTGKATKVELGSSVQQVFWSSRVAAPGAMVGLEVHTHNVGNGSEIQVELSDVQGKSHGSYKDTIAADRFWATIRVPQEAREGLVATVKLPKHGQTMKSPPLLLLPLVEIRNAKWDKKEARDGEILKISADIAGVPDGSVAEVAVFEHDQDAAHDLITRMQAVVRNKKVEAEWTFVYQEDRDNVPTAAETESGYSNPEYFFRVTVGGISADSAVVKFQDWVTVKLTNGAEEPIEGERYILHLADGSTIEGKTDSEGMLKKENLPPGPVYVEFPAYFQLYEVRGGVPHGMDPPAAPAAPAVTLESSGPAGEPTQVRIAEDAPPETEEEVAPAGEQDSAWDEESERELVREREEEPESEAEAEQEIAGTKTFSAARMHEVSGALYHLGLFGRLSFLACDASGRPLTESVKYVVKDESGAAIDRGTAKPGEPVHLAALKVETHTVVIGATEYDIVPTLRQVVQKIRVAPPESGS